jgi:hypothetical protein
LELFRDDLNLWNYLIQLYLILRQILGILRYLI